MKYKNILLVNDINDDAETFVLVLNAINNKQHNNKDLNMRIIFILLFLRLKQGPGIRDHIV